MNFKSFKNSFVKISVPFYIIECSDKYLRSQAKKFILQTFQDDFTPVTYSLSDTEFQEIYENFKSSSLFGENFLIFVTDCNNNENDILQLINSKKNYKNKIIFIFEKIKSKKLLETAKKNNILFTISLPNKNELLKIVKNFFIKHNFKTASNVENFIIENTPNDLESLYSELKKILDFHSKENILEIEDVKKIIFSTKEENIFNFIDNFLSKNRENTMKIFQNLIQLKTDIEFILNMLINNVSNILLINSLIFEKKMQYKDIQSTLNINPYALKKQFPKAKNSSLEELTSLLEKLIILQYKIRISGKDRELIFKNFLINYL